ncbi:hypothetical protein HMPREF1870_01329 [Bacteroidales bacterium KA00344]|nr:hypothetical protein HMPREF1870_01329 [Bacteroidales bacterium KA00344]
MIARNMTTNGLDLSQTGKRLEVIFERIAPQELFYVDFIDVLIKQHDTSMKS